MVSSRSLLLFFARLDLARTSFRQILKNESIGIFIGISSPTVIRSGGVAGEFQRYW